MPRLDWADDVAWLSTDGPDGYEELELEPDDFDVVFAYPWPGEEQVIFDLFADSAAVGALLLTYHGHEGVQAAAQGEAMRLTTEARRTRRRLENADR